MPPCTWMKLWYCVPYHNSYNRGWRIKTNPIKYPRIWCKSCMILFSSLPADKDLQFHIVKQARAQSAKEGAGYSEGKEQANTNVTSPTSCRELLLSPSLLLPSFHWELLWGISLHLFLIFLSLHIWEHGYFLYLGQLDERLRVCCAHTSIIRTEKTKHMRVAMLDCFKTEKVYKNCAGTSANVMLSFVTAPSSLIPLHFIFWCVLWPSRAPG